MVNSTDLARLLLELFLNTDSHLFQTLHWGPYLWALLTSLKGEKTCMAESEMVRHCEQLNRTRLK